MRTPGAVNTQPAPLPSSQARGRTHRVSYQRRRALAVVIAIGALLVAAALPLARAASAQPIDERSIPPVLRPWVPWVLEAEPDRACPLVSGSPACLWPGRLELDLTTSGGRFALRVDLDRRLLVPLPGDSKRWPLSVRVSGKAAPVVAQGDRPFVFLEPGSHSLDGRFDWPRLPDSLPVPSAIGLVDLRVAGRPIAFPRREEDGTLLLRSEETGTSGGENLRLRVFRRLADGIPLTLDTRLAFEASGRAREVRLEGALLAGAIAVAVTGDLPARLDRDGTLRVQVRGGRFQVEVRSRLTGQPTRFALPKSVLSGAAKDADPWPAQEIWVFEAKERFRQAQVQGAPSVDPSRTDLPEDWRAWPAFLMEKGTELTLKEGRRGEPDASPDRLALRRTLWLDESGANFTVRDVVTGLVSQTTRIDLQAPGELGRATDGEEDQLITEDPKSKRPGFEVRSTTANLSADSRLPRGGALPAVGWDVNVQSLTAELRLPPGWSLLFATGVDRVPASWFGRFTLFGFFVILVIALGSFKLVDRRWAAVALLTLTLCHGELDAPSTAWLVLLGATALVLTRPGGRFAKLAKATWALTAGFLAFFLVTFSVGQIRGGLYPQTMNSAGLPGLDSVFRSAGLVQGVGDPYQAPGPALKGVELTPSQDQASNLPAAPAVDRAYAYKRKAEVAQVQSNTISVSKVEAYRQDPNAIIQTGTGLPSWTWNRGWALIWSGPVSKEHTMRLFLLSPFANLLLAFARVGLVWLFFVRLLRIGFDGLRPKPSDAGIAPIADSPGPASTPAAVALLLLVLAFPASAQSQQVSKADNANTTNAATSALETGVPNGELAEILGELKGRLLRRPPCFPNCLATPTVAIAISGNELRIAAEVHAGLKTAWPIPGPATSWVPRAVSVDGTPTSALARLPGGFLHVRLSEGVHQVVVTGPLPNTDSLTLQFADRPKRATATTPGWQVDGLREDGVEASVQLTRLLKTRETRDADGTYEPWLEVTRRFDIGVTWTVETTVRRVSPLGAPVVVKVPLLKGMLVTDADRRVEDGRVLISLGRDQTETGWMSTLTPEDGAELVLAAAESEPWTEVWAFHCGPVWQCDAAGLPPVERSHEGRLVPEYRPWPGEKLTLKLRRPKGLAGQTLTLERTVLSLAPGVRLLDATLEIHTRASRSGIISIALPKSAEIQSLRVGDSERPVRPADSKDAKTADEAPIVPVTIDSGSWVVRLSWRQPGGLGPFFRAPKIAIGGPGVNASLTIRLPDDRWLLLTGGPRWGPAVLFWGRLILVLLLAALLGRIPKSPLTSWQWLLLTLGIAQLPLIAGAILACWFFALALRKTHSATTPFRHNLLQLILIGWTLVAMGLLYAAVHQGLLLRPDMQVAGNGSSDSSLSWYQDWIDKEGHLPRPWVISVPIWVYRILMLFWALWLAKSLIAWARWTWDCLTAGGLWRKSPPRAPLPPPIPGPPPVMRAPEEVG